MSRTIAAPRRRMPSASVSPRATAACSVGHRAPARTNHAMATLGSEVVVFGGTPTARPFYEPSLPAPAGEGDTWTWDGTTWTKLAPAASPPARMNHAMATLGNKVILFGGEGAGG